MNMKSLTLSGLAAAICMCLVDGLWHEVILAGFMSYLYPKLYLHGGTVIDGLKFGMLMGLLWVFPHELAMVRRTANRLPMY